MKLDQKKFSETLSLFAEMNLISQREVNEILSLFGQTFPFGGSLERADSVHVHIKVDDTAALPHAQIMAAGSSPENQKEGYVKYPFAGGVNMIFSSIDVAEEDRLKDAPKAPRPFVDHLGIDLREEAAETRALFDDVPGQARSLGWRHVAQGGQGKAVYCCHVEVAEKHWVYPPADSSAWTRPIEFAFGPLKINAGSMGCDLRPIDPSHPSARAASCGAAKSCSKQT